jgi:hypothetical protein
MLANVTQAKTNGMPGAHAVISAPTLPPDDCDLHKALPFLPERKVELAVLREMITGFFVTDAMQPGCRAQAMLRTSIKRSSPGR